MKEKVFLENYLIQNHLHTKMNKKIVYKQIEICNECGRDVSAGSGLFVNRIIDFNDKEYRKEMGKPFYKGDFICIECDLKIRGDLAEI
jgi:diaminopimelate decarboxylase